MKLRGFGFWVIVGLLLVCGTVRSSAQVQKQRPGSPKLQAPNADPTESDDTPNSGQAPKPENRFKRLDDAEEFLDEKMKKEKERLLPPLELLRSQVAPFDVLPFAKPDHWATIGLELQANLADFRGQISTSFVPLRSMSRSMIFERDANLTKSKQTRLTMNVFLPRIPKQLGVEFSRRDLPAPMYATRVPLRILHPHQMLVMILAKNPTAYSSWTRLNATLPISADRSADVIEQTRYYRFVIPLKPEKPLLSTNPLTWTSISHVIWDELATDTLDLDQQQSLLDWIHWGGQLVISGGAGSWYAPLKESSLGPYLPADVAGQNSLLDRQALEPLARKYRPLAPPEDVKFMAEEEKVKPAVNEALTEGFDPLGDSMPDGRYRPAMPILPDLKRPVYFVGLSPRLEIETRVLRVGDATSPILGVERRLGRGRILMLAFNPNDPSFAAWTGLDSFVRRVLLRRPEETYNPQWANSQSNNPFLHKAPQELSYRFLSGPELSWYRIATRDIGPPSRSPLDYQNPDGQDSEGTETPDENTPIADPTPDSDLKYLPAATVAAWRDDFAVPVAARQMLLESSGIRIPSSRFVLTLLIAYIIALVPLNWLICRSLFGKKEWAWAFMPILALGFAIGVERAAAFDLGYDLASNEIDILELQGAYSRGHLTRFGSLYSSSRKSFAIAFPENSTAVALPMDSGVGERGEEQSESIFESTPVSVLRNFPVQPRSLSLYRSEELVNVGGSIRHEIGTDGKARIVNQTNLELRDVELIRTEGKTNDRTPLGTIAPGATAVVGAETAATVASTGASKSDEALIGKLDPGPWLDQLGGYRWPGPEDLGELRLVAWTPGPSRGEIIAPAVEKHTGITIIIAHLRYGTASAPTPDESMPGYDAIAGAIELAKKQKEADASSLKRLGGPPPPSPGLPNRNRRRNDPHPIHKLMLLSDDDCL